MKQPEIISGGSGERREIALTFDDGPSRWTAEIAGVLEEHGCNATFFLLPVITQTSPDPITRIPQV